MFDVPTMACLLSSAATKPPSPRVAIMSLLLHLLVYSHLLITASAFSTTTAESSSSKLIRLLPDGSANDILYQLLQEQHQEEQQQQETITTDNCREPSSLETHSSPTPILIQLTGAISKRRAIGKHLIFLDVIPVDKIPTLQEQQNKGVHFDSLSEIAPVQAIMRRDFWNDIHQQRSDDNNNFSNNTISSSFDVYHKIIQPGTFCTIHGHVGPSRNQKEAILFCTSLKYRLANNNPQHLRNVLKFAADDALDVTEVLEALPTLSHPDELIPSTSTSTAAVVNQTYGELATQILDIFPPKFLLNPSQLMGSTDAAKVQLLPPIPHEFGTLPPFIINDDGEVKEKVAVSESLTISQALKHDNGLVSITGWVQNRRRYQGSVSVLEVVDTFSSSFPTVNDDEDDDSNNNISNDNDGVNSKKLKELWKERIYAVIHPDALCSQEMAEIYGNLLSAGARVAMEGFMTSDKSSDDANTASFWVTRMRLLRSSWRQGEIRTLLDLLHEGKFDVEEAAGALDIPYSQAEELAEGTATPAERQWLAAEITMNLQGENSRVGKISNSMMESLSTFAYARDSYPIQGERTRLAADANSSQHVASSILKSNQGGNPRRTSLDGSRWQHKKRPQLEL